MPAAYLKITGSDAVNQAFEDAILESVELEQELNQHWWCTIEWRNTEDKRIPIEDLIGDDFQVQCYDQDGTEIDVFDGFVLDAELICEPSGSFTARVQAVTYSYCMEVTPRAAYYVNKDLKGIVDDLVSNNSWVLSDDVKVNATSASTFNYVQWGESDWKFLNRIVDDHEAWIRPSGGAFEISNAFTDGSKLQWRTEDGLLSFKIKATINPTSLGGAHYQATMHSKTYQDVSDNADFYDSLKTVVAKTKDAAASVPGGYIYQRSRIVALDDFENLLKKEARRGQGKSVSAHGESRNPNLKPGDTVDIDGNDDIKGTYGLTRVVHRWSPFGYTNEFSCTPWKKYTNPQAPVARAWPGVINARVVDNTDAWDMGAIKIQYFWQEENQTGWARMITPHAGADRGFLFMPEVGDEVLVSFLDGDVERPIVLGSLWNGVDQAPREDFWGGDMKNNDIKRIVTKSGHRMQFVDKKGKESIVVATPNDLKISLIECASETGRPMITLSSASGDILLSAPNGRIHFCSKFFSREVGV